MFLSKIKRRHIPTTCVMAAMALAACSPKQQARPAAPPQVTVVTVKRTTVPVTVNLPGRISAYRIAQVRARVDGIVQARRFEEGADVNAHQTLYQIDPAQYRTALNSALAAGQKAQASLATTSAQAERYKVLLNGNAVSKQEYDNAVAAQQQAAADVAGAQAAIAMARLSLGYTDVVAPISGRSGVSQVTQGAYVQASAATLLTTIQQIDPIYVDLTQASVAGLQLRHDVASGHLTLSGPNQPKVTLTLEDGSEYALPGQLQFSGTTVDPSTGSVTLRALFPNPHHVLLPGMFVRARVTEGVNDQALLVPVRAVSHDAKGQAMVLVVGADNKTKQRAVQTKDIRGDAWVITAGLSENERVVVDGLQKVQPGMTVQALEALPQATPAALAKADTGDASTPLTQ
jgi:membrane fusion protein (multidrug efflux system)